MDIVVVLVGGMGRVVNVNFCFSPKWNPSKRRNKNKKRKWNNGMNRRNACCRSIAWYFYLNCVYTLWLWNFVFFSFFFFFFVIADVRMRWWETNCILESFSGPIWGYKRPVDLIWAALQPFRFASHTYTYTHTHELFSRPTLPCNFNRVFFILIYSLILSSGFFVALSQSLVRSVWRAIIKPCFSKCFRI